MPRVFFITGCGRGLGHALAQFLLNAGEYVVATTRKASDLSFENTTSSNYLHLKLDVTSPSDIESGFNSTLEKFGRVDVVINNAALPIAGALESLTDAQVRSVFDTNFFPIVTIIRRAINIMRTQSPPGGMLIQLGGLGSVIGFPMVSAVCASKIAIDAFSEGIQSEMRPEWNIKFTSVKLDGINTDAHRESVLYGDVEVGPEYEHVNARKFIKTLSDAPLADKNDAARKIYEISKMADPPLNAIAGPSALDLFKQKCEKDQELLAQGVIFP